MHPKWHQEGLCALSLNFLLLIPEVLKNRQKRLNFQSTDLFKMRGCELISCLGSALEVRQGPLFSALSLSEERMFDGLALVSV